MRANWVYRVLLGVVLAMALTLGSSSALISLQKTQYVLGEEIPISLNVSSMDGLKLEISSNGAIFTYIGNEKNFNFIPTNEGFYEASLINSSYGTVKESLQFAVLSPSELSVFTHKKSYKIGETVTIYIDSGYLNNTYNLSIKTGTDIFYFLGQLQNQLKFVPRSLGPYEVSLASSKSAAKTNFTVEALDSLKVRKSSVKVTSAKKTYILGESIELYLTFPKDSDLQFYITSGSNAYKYFGMPGDRLTFFPKDVGDYHVVIEETGTVLASYSFSVAARPVLSAEKALGSVKYSFDLNQDAAIEADFSDKITRNAAQIALQSTILEQVTAYVSGHEEDSDFSLGLEHIEFDKFKVTIASNANIKPGIYKLVIAGKYNKKTYKKEILFNWGLSDEIDFFSELKGKETPLASSITLGKINYRPGEPVIIRTNLSGVKIIFSGKTFTLSSGFVPELLFAPPFEGMYTVTAQDDFGNAAEQSFTVSGAAASETFFSTEETQAKAEIGKPVKWKKTIRFRNGESDLVSLQVPMPKEVLSLNIFSDSWSLDSSIALHDESNSILEFNDELLPF